MTESNHDTLKSAKTASPWSRLWSRLTKEPEPTAARQLYERLVAHARFPLYFRDLGVADTPEGRFEVLALHVGLAVRRLCSLDKEGQAEAQVLFDLMMADMDMNMRELGVGDLSVGKQVKRLAQQFYARLAVLNEAFDEGKIEVLQPMLETNLFVAGKPGPDAAARFSTILQELERAFHRHSLDDLKAGLLTLPDEQTLSSLGEHSAYGGHREGGNA